MMSPKRVKRKIEWTIENVTHDEIENEDFLLFSNDFILTLGDNVTKWRLSISTDPTYLVVLVHKLSVDRDDFLIKTTFESDYCIPETNDEKSSFYEIGIGRGFPEAIYLDELLYADFDLEPLKLNFEIEIFYPDEVQQADPVPIPIKRRKTYSSHFTDRRFADFTLKSSDEKEYQVHRLVLADKSEYFEKMFTVNMQEKSKGEAFLQNVHSSTLEMIIEFMYKGTAEIIDVEKAKNVLNAAEEFVIPDLKLICSDFLLKEVNDENALEMLKIADLYDSKELEMKSLENIVNNYDNLKDTENWQTLTLPLAKKIMDAFANNREIIKFHTIL